jgi:hypothetical protein
MAKQYQTDAVWLDVARGRFRLTVDILQSVGWQAPAMGTTLVAELVQEGHIRLHLQKAIESRIAADVTRAGEEPDPVLAGEQKQVVADRYHEVRFSRADNDRVTLRPEAVMALVGDRADERVRLFLQVGDSTVDVMTNAVRLARLKRFPD